MILDGKYLNEKNKGKHVKIDKNRRSYIIVSKPDMYNLVNVKEFRNYDLKMEIASNEFMLFAFTFG